MISSRLKSTVLKRGPPSNLQRAKAPIWGAKARSEARFVVRLVCVHCVRTVRVPCGCCVCLWALRVCSSRAHALLYPALSLLALLSPCSAACVGWCVLVLLCRPRVRAASWAACAGAGRCRLHWVWKPSVVRSPLSPCSPCSCSLTLSLCCACCGA